jgi:hypothetical protein
MRWQDLRRSGNVEDDAAAAVDASLGVGASVSRACRRRLFHRRPGGRRQYSVAKPSLSRSINGGAGQPDEA